jgi:hypothetical protein
MSYEGLLLQTLANNNSSSSMYYNIALGYKKYKFENNLITINRRNSFETKITPEYIIFNIANNYGAILDTIKHFVSPLQLNFSIGDIEIFKIPLSFLWNLKEPEIINYKLYLSIPFSLFFGDIHLCGLEMQNITFNLVNNRNENMINYITGYHLLCKTFLTPSSDENLYTDLSYNIIQQLSSVNVKVNMENQIVQSNEFRIRTNMFRGFIKGFFIEANSIKDLDEILFYINDSLRIDYDKYMIENICVKINSRMIYIPFNNDIAYYNREYNSYIGSINIDRIDNSFFNLKFLTPRNQVCIYAFTMNIYNQMQMVGSIQVTYPMQHLVQDFSYHTLTPIEDLLRQNRIESYSNSTISNSQDSNRRIIDESHSINNVAVGYTSNTLNRFIENEERNICHISQLPIEENQRYMLCRGCLNCYNEMDLIQWFQSLNNNNQFRSCPTCREMWRDYNVYINSLEEDIIEGNIILTNIS